MQARCVIFCDSSLIYFLWRHLVVELTFYLTIYRTSPRVGSEASGTIAVGRFDAVLLSCYARPYLHGLFSKEQLRSGPFAHSTFTLGVGEIDSTFRTSNQCQPGKHAFCTRRDASDSTSDSSS